MLLKTKIIALAAALVLPIIVQADSLLPELPKAKKKYSEETLCVEPVEEMQKNHMSYILDQRDETLRKGIRTKQHSLQECINCHNAPADDGKVARAEESEHFCSTCHVYAAVSIDCFSCHSDKPQNTQYRHSLSATELSKHLNIATQGMTIESAETLEFLASNHKEGQQ